VTAHLDHRPTAEVVSEFGFIDFTNNSGQVYLQQSYLAQHPEQAGWNQGQRLSYLHSTAVHIILAHPGAYLRLCIPELLKTVFFPSVYGLSNPKVARTPTYSAVIADQGLAAWRLILARAQAHPWVMAENTFFWLLLQGLYLFAARGFLRGRAHPACQWLLLGASLYFLAVLVASPMASSRFRMPVMPVVCIFAAAGFLRAKAAATSIPNNPRAGPRPC